MIGTIALVLLYSGAIASAQLCRTDLDALQNTTCHFPCFRDQGVKTCIGDDVHPRYNESITNLRCMAGAVMTDPELDVSDRINPIYLVCDRKAIVDTYETLIKAVGVPNKRVQTDDDPVQMSQQDILEMKRALEDELKAIVDAKRREAVERKRNSSRQ